ncbi:Dabb family protein [Nonomuraea guangzhouensis]|uniref:Dabb family protein n=1 Tax=Nonomuraea guangzhouensis TaxID=1291555 RepID=A0ABW4GU72_9ACTN|nr:Dabb family protein [Nonomuraea guangzhouensis]
MIRHIVLFKLKPQFTWRDECVVRAERMAAEVGRQVGDLLEWRVGRNVSDRDIAYDFVVMGLVSDEEALQRYLVHPFHQQSVRQWREISDWVVADLEE